MTTARAPMACTEAVERLWDFLDGEIDDMDRAALDGHLAWCIRCCGELAFARHVRSMLHDRSPVTVPTEVQDRLETFIDELCETDDEVAGP